MKKLSLLFSVLLTSTIVLSGCSSAGNKNSDSTSTEKSNEPPYTIKYAYLALGPIPKDVQMVSEELSKLTLKKINANIELTPISMAQYSQQINLMISSNEKLDVMTQMGHTLTGDVAKNQLLALDTYLQKNGAEVTKALGNYIKAGQVNGKTYAVPAIRNMGNSYGIAMRKDILDKYKIEPTTIKTLDDVEAMFKKVQAGEPNLIMTMPQTSSNSMYSGLYSNFDNLGDGINMGVLTNFGQGALKVENLIETPEYANGLKFIRNWFNQGYILKDAPTNAQTGPNLIKAGKVFSYFTNLKPGFDMQATNQTGMQMVSATLIPAFAVTGAVAQFSMAIPVTCKNPEKTTQFLNLMYSDPEVLNMINFGIEGKHYAKVSGTSNVIDYAQGVTASTIGYSTNSGFQFGNQLLDYVWKGDSPDVYKELANFNKSAKLSKAFGFNFDGTMVKTEYAALTNVSNQYKLALEDGLLDPDSTLPKFKAALKDAGIDKYIAEKQKQLDAWAKSQGK